MKICFFHHHSFTSFAYLWYVNVHMTVATSSIISTNLRDVHREFMLIKFKVYQTIKPISQLKMNDARFSLFEPLELLDTRTRSTRSHEQ